MGSNRSLDEFLGGNASDEDPETDEGAGPGEHAEDAGEGSAGGEDADGEETAASAAPEAATPSKSGATSDDAPDAEPVAGTYRWDPDGAACAACGTAARTRWRDDDRWVCPSCKAW